MLKSIVTRRAKAFTLAEVLLSIFIIATSFLSLFGLLGVSVMMRTERTLGADDENFAEAFFSRFDVSPEMAEIFQTETPTFNTAAQNKLREHCMAALDASGWANDPNLASLSTTKSSVELANTSDWRNSIEDNLRLETRGAVYRIQMLNREITIQFESFNVKEVEDQAPLENRLVRITMDIVTNLPSESLNHKYVRYAFIAPSAVIEGHGPWTLYGHGSLSKGDVWTSPGYPDDDSI